MTTTTNNKNTQNIIKEAVQQIREGNLVAMKESVTSALSTKAVEALEEKRIQIASTYFGQK